MICFACLCAVWLDPPLIYRLYHSFLSFITVFPIVHFLPQHAGIDLLHVCIKRHIESLMVSISNPYDGCHTIFKVGSRKRHLRNDFLDRNTNGKRSQRHPVGQLGHVDTILCFILRHRTVCFTIVLAKGNQSQGMKPHAIFQSLSKKRNIGSIIY